MFHLFCDFLKKCVKKGRGVVTIFLKRRRSQSRVGGRVDGLKREGLKGVTSYATAKNAVCIGL